MSEKRKKSVHKQVVTAIACGIVALVVACVVVSRQPQGTGDATRTVTQATTPASEQAASQGGEQSGVQVGQTQAPAGDDVTTSEPANSAQNDVEAPQDSATGEDQRADNTNVNASDGVAGEQPEPPAEQEAANEGAGDAASPAEPFVMPEGAEYQEDQVLLSIAPSADPAQVEQLLASVPGVVPQQVSADDMERGLVAASLEPGTSVEDAVNALLNTGSSVVMGSQPNYIYHIAEAQETVAQEETTVLADQDAPATEEAANASDPAATAQTSDTVEVAVDEDQTPAQDEVRVQEEAQPAGEAQSQDGQKDPVLAEQNAQAVDGGGAETVNEPNDPRFNDQWNLKSIRALDAWELVKEPSNPKVSVAVVDDGFKLDHADLAGNIVANSAYNSNLNNKDVSPTLGNHGTHVAGIVAAVANNNLGIAGVTNNKVSVVPIKAFDDKGNASTDTLDRAYNYILKNQANYNIKVVNLSLGAGMASDDIEDMRLMQDVREAYAKNIVTVGASCNVSPGGSSTYDDKAPFYAYPSDSEYVVSVIHLDKTKEGAENSNDASKNYEVNRASSSNYNCEGQGGTKTRKGKNISAPGGNIYSTDKNGDYTSLSGTSQATPLVSGVVALEFVANHKLTADEATNILYASAYDLGEPGWDREYGYGEVNAYDAVMMATRGMPTRTVTRTDGEETIGFKLAINDETNKYTYDGNPKEPSVPVVPITNEGSEGEPLNSETDYTLTYSNNTNAGMGCVTVTGAGTYKGLTWDLHFSIGRQMIADNMVTVSTNPVTYDARAYKPTVKVSGGATCTVSYSNNTNAGTATVMVLGSGNYGGVIYRNFTINKRDINAGVISATCSPARLTYTGSAQRPSVTLKHRRQDGSTYTLVQNTDYTVSYANNTNAGTATVTITGKGNYSGKRTLKCSIAPASMSKASISGIGNRAYMGTAITPEPYVAFGGRQLRSGSDYTVSYENNVASGTATVTVTGKGNFTGTASTTFQIVEPHVSYRTHVQRVGWQRYVSDGDMSGTSGRSLRLEGINIELSSLPCGGGIEYRTHVQRVGWQGWRRDGDMSGTKGRSLRLESIQIRLYGEMAEKYDVYYRVHCQRFGWMGWACNGDQSGSAGYSRRLEGIQVVLVPKGQPGPDTTFKGISQNVWRAFAQKGKK
ncbi:MAG: S8 family serine peptidase [Coriobacteriales bacterium]|nr:S8 family serine peptidase [Coriobacteriales bacterium]